MTMTHYTQRIITYNSWEKNSYKLPIMIILRLLDHVALAPKEVNHSSYLVTKYAPNWKLFLLALNQKFIKA